MRTIIFFKGLCWKRDVEIKLFLLNLEYFNNQSTSIIIFRKIIFYFNILKSRSFINDLSLKITSSYFTIQLFIRIIGKVFTWLLFENATFFTADSSGKDFSLASVDGNFRFCKMLVLFCTFEINYYLKYYWQNNQIIKSQKYTFP